MGVQKRPAVTSELAVRKANSRDGFTLVEMLVVLMIIAVLYTAAYPRISGYMKMSRDQYRANHEYMVNKALMQYYALTGSYYMVSGLAADMNLTDVQATALINDIKKITGALIEDPSGTYEYEVSGVETDPDRGIWAIKSVKVKSR